MAELDRRADARTGFVAVLSDLLGVVEGHLHVQTDDDLHDLRVAVRRTRSLLGNSKKVVPGHVRKDARALFKRMADCTGVLRDLDVLAAAWPGYVGDLDEDAVGPLRRALEARRAAATAALGPCIHHPEVADGLAAWRRWLDGPHDPLGRPLGVVVATRIGRAQRTVLDAGRALTAESPPEAAHELRKDGKVLRYLVDAFGGLFPKSERKPYLKALKQLQTVLGANQDAAVHIDLVAELAAEAGATEAAGPLLAVLERRRADAQASVLPAFAEYDTDANGDRLDAILDALAGERSV